MLKDLVDIIEKDTQLKIKKYYNNLEKQLGKKNKDGFLIGQLVFNLDDIFQVEKKRSRSKRKSNSNSNSNSRQSRSRSNSRQSISRSKSRQSRSRSKSRQSESRSKSRQSRSKSRQSRSRSKSRQSSESNSNSSQSSESNSNSISRSQKGGGKKKGKGKGKVTTLSMANILNGAPPPEPTEVLENNGHIGRILNNDILSHQKLYEYYFRNLFSNAGNNLSNFVEELEVQCSLQTPDTNVSVKISRNDEKMIVIEFRTGKIIPEQPQFHLSVHKMGGIKGRAGLVHVVKEHGPTYNGPKWETEVLFTLKTNSLNINGTPKASISAISSHNPQIIKGKGKSSTINSLVERPSAYRLGAPTIIMRYGVTISRVLIDYINKIHPLELI